MASRNPSQIHDRAVRARAEQLKQQGWKVKATVPGFEQPEPIGQNSRIPDIQALRGGRTKLVEVKTESDLNTPRNMEQIATFRRSVSQREKANLAVVVVPDP